MKISASYIRDVLTAAFGIGSGYKIGAAISDKEWVKTLCSVVGWTVTEAVISSAKKEESKAQHEPTATIEEIDKFVKEHPKETLASFWAEKERSKGNAPQSVSR